MKALFVFYFAVLIFSPRLNALIRPAGPERLILSLAEKAAIPFPADQKIRVGDKSLIAFQAGAGQISILARKKGRTLLSAGSKKYEIFIFNQADKIKALKLDQLVKSFLGLSWTLSKDQSFQITGRLYRVSDWAALAALSKKYGFSYQFKASIGEELRPVIHHYFTEFLKSRRPLQASSPPDIAWADLPLAFYPKGASLLEYKKIFQDFGLELKEDPLWIYQSPFIEIGIAAAESSEAAGFSFGGAGFLENALKSFSSLFDFLNFLKSSGKGRTLMNTSVRGQSGQELNIQSGGQIPFNSFNVKTEQNSADWKPYGLSIKLTPQISKRQTIALDIEMAVSEPASFSSGGPPPLKTQSWSSRLVLKNGQIAPIFHKKKKTIGSSLQGRLSLLSPGSFFRDSNSWQSSQMFFIQAKIINAEEGYGSEHR